MPISYRNDPTPRDAALVWLLVTAAIAAATALGRESLGWAWLPGLLAPNLLFWVPLAVLRRRRDSWRDFGLRWDRWPRDLAWGLGAAAVALPAFTLAYRVWWGGDAVAWRFDARLLVGLPLQLVVVALPEEVFFRGYLQTVVGRLWPTRGGVAAIVIVSAAFALTHFAAVPSVGRLAVFFPALVMGALRVRTGGVLAPIVFHVLANATIYMLEGGW